MMTIKNIALPDKIVSKYLKSLIGKFYKILPIAESREPSLIKYMNSLQREMLGCNSLIVALEYDPLYMTLLSILQYLITYECEIPVVRSEVFRAIDICERLAKKYCVEEADENGRLGFV